jgi:hypothetical protein
LDSKTPARQVIKIKPAPEERLLLDDLMDATGYPSQRAVIFDALRSFSQDLAAGHGLVGCLLDFPRMLSALERGLEEDRVLSVRLQLLLGAYQRDFQLFSILHECRVPAAAPRAAQPSSGGSGPTVSPVSSVVDETVRVMREIVSGETVPSVKGGDNG